MSDEPSEVEAYEASLKRSSTIGMLLFGAILLLVGLASGWICLRIFAHPVLFWVCGICLPTGARLLAASLGFNPAWLEVSGEAGDGDDCGDDGGDD